MHSQGYILDCRDSSVMKIFGSGNDLKFECASEVQPVSSGKLITICVNENKNILIVQLHASAHGSYFETRRIKNYDIVSYQLNYDIA